VNIIPIEICFVFCFRGNCFLNIWFTHQKSLSDSGFHFFASIFAQHIAKMAAFDMSANQKRAYGG